MERLTKKKNGLVGLKKCFNECQHPNKDCNCRINMAARHKLASYKDIGLMPEEIREFMIDIGKFGKTVFLTKEETEKARKNKSKKAINHPSHYNYGKIEVIEVIEDWKLGFHLGNAVKYIGRAKHKGNNTEVEDLKKAAWYLEREIERLEK